MKNQFTSRIVKLSFAFMFVLIASSCSQDDEALDAAVLAKEVNSEIAGKGAKTTATATAESFTWPTIVCAGISFDFCLNFPQATKGNGDPKKTNVQVQLLVYGDDPATSAIETEYYIQIGQANENTQYCFNYEFVAAGDYQLRYKIGDGGFTKVAVTVVNCNSCNESFSYVDNEDGSYTFKYTPAEDMTNAELVFTFAQGTYVSGLDTWTDAGVTKHKTMNLNACQEYTWIVVLQSNCKSNNKNQEKGQTKANVWTDFKVLPSDFDSELDDENNYSKKNDDTPTINMSCSN